ncbi:MAG TPA: universal stress protein [Gemmatimonadaceae bacterium]
MYARVLVPLDGSPFAELVLPAAVALARHMGAGLELLRVHPYRPLDYTSGADADEVRLDAREEEDERAYVEEVAARFAAEGPPVIPRVVVHRSVATALAEEAAATPATLLVMTSHGRTGLRRSVVGSVADAVLRAVEVPLLLWRPAPDDDPAPDRFERLLVPLDGSPFAEAVLPHALQLSAADEARLTLVRVVQPVLDVMEPVALMPFGIEGAGAAPAMAVVDRPATARALVEARRYLAAVAARIRPKFPRVWIDVRAELAEDPGAALILAAAQAGADLVAMTTHARGVGRLFVGSTADQLLKGRHGATLLMHPQAIPA